MSRTLSLRNRQRVRRVDTALFRRIILHVLDRQLQVHEFELAFHLVSSREMSRVNWTFLRHEGSTDVITFDHSATPARLKQPPPNVHGEIFICIDDAVNQARAFRTTWQSELTRYVIHGLLHLRGHDDGNPAARRRMKFEESRILRNTAGEFPLAELDRTPHGPGRTSSRMSPTAPRSTA